MNATLYTVNKKPHKTYISYKGYKNFSLILVILLFLTYHFNMNNYQKKKKITDKLSIFAQNQFYFRVTNVLYIGALKTSPIKMLY